MPRIAYYYQDCPTCGRSLQVRVEYLGRTLCCPHCRGAFRAADSSSVPRSTGERRLTMLDRANELLNSVHSLHHSDWN
jgi:uncharacterized protein YbaR (Trm112 family)